MPHVARASPAPALCDQVALAHQGVATTRLVVLLSRDMRSASAADAAAARARRPRLQGVALGHRDVVAADAVAVAELVDAHQVRHGGVQRRGVLLEIGVQGDCFHC